nr:hypothetical protein [uncultured Pseudomonas sp.]
MDIDLAAAHGQMLEERTAEFQFDPARMQAQRQQAAAEVMHTRAVKQSACDALAYEVLRAQAQRRVADRAGQERKRLALLLMKQQQGEAVP